MIKKIGIIITCLLTVFISVGQFRTVKAYENESGYAEIVMDTKTNRVLYGNKIYEKRYPASTTKILTAIVIIENCNLSDIVKVTKNTVGVEGSSIYLEEGEELSVKDLLYGLMLRSGNDCAETLAQYCSGSIDSFVDLMNNTAKKIGATNSHFANPHGLHNDNHYTTAYDLALISSYAIKNSVFKEIVSTKSVKIPFSTHDYVRHIKNKNKMLTEFDGATGIKTGYTKKAGRCLVTSCDRNGMELVSVVLNCQPMWERSKEILTNCFNQYSYCKLVNKEYIVDFIKMNNIKIPLYIKNDIELPLKDEEKSKVDIIYDLIESFDKIENNDTEIGYIKIYIENNLIFEEKIYTIL